MWAVVALHVLQLLPLVWIVSFLVDISLSVLSSWLVYIYIHAFSLSLLFFAQVYLMIVPKPIGGLYRRTSTTQFLIRKRKWIEFEIIHINIKGFMWHVASGSCKSIKENMAVVIVTVFCVALETESLILSSIILFNMEYVRILVWLKYSHLLCYVNFAAVFRWQVFSLLPGLLSPLCKRRHTRADSFL